jgi:hypothetical protein
VGKRFEETTIRVRNNERQEVVWLQTSNVMSKSSTVYAAHLSSAWPFSRLGPLIQSRIALDPYWKTSGIF